ncbi:nucleoside triphosphate pyrophosphohydrolase [Alkalihalobacillus sp. CinArs1]|uniref:nucleoside triphosphate pyrophosphohydrolase n=1 Tax=Alkalihalobacillus sp. CinArs1 TaxID=2995314 RepID=UPI0022DE418A|nr:nucleoside triphosphate pyrophosphohydrolase [Alkalihalobacillus sp. CinArs1]
MPTYNKLIRDNIPQIIKATGKDFNTKNLNDVEYKEELQTKLKEELEEYLKATKDNESIEELADMLEIIYSLTTIHHSSIEKLEKVRKEKKVKRGGFEKKIYLIDVEDE